MGASAVSAVANTDCWREGMLNRLNRFPLALVFLAEWSGCYRWEVQRSAMSVSTGQGDLTVCSLPFALHNEGCPVIGLTPILLFPHRDLRCSKCCSGR